jgi:hypothetical protein
VPLVSVRPEPMVRAPIEPPGNAYGIWEERDEIARPVVVALVVVEFEAVKFWRVVEELRKVCAPLWCRKPGKGHSS